MTGIVSKHTNLIGFGSQAVTGSATIKVGDIQMTKIEKVMANIQSATAPSNAPHGLTVKVAANGQSAVIYAWKSTANDNTTPIAATVAITVDYVVIGE